MIKENEVEIETKDKKYFVKLGPTRPHVICKDKERHTYHRIDHPAVSYVSSESDKDKEYMVISHPEGWICTCKSWQYHGECKHIRAVKNAEDSSHFDDDWCQKLLDFVD